MLNYLTETSHIIAWPTENTYFNSISSLCILVLVVSSVVALSRWVLNNRKRIQRILCIMGVLFGLHGIYALGLPDLPWEGWDVLSLQQPTRTLTVHQGTPTPIPVNKSSSLGLTGELLAQAFPPEVDLGGNLGTGGKRLEGKDSTTLSPEAVQALATLRLKSDMFKYLCLLLGIVLLAREVTVLNDGVKKIFQWVWGSSTIGGRRDGHPPREEDTSMSIIGESLGRFLRRVLSAYKSEAENGTQRNRSGSTGEEGKVPSIDILQLCEECYLTGLKFNNILGEVTSMREMMQALMRQVEGKIFPGIGQSTWDEIGKSDMVAKGETEQPDTQHAWETRKNSQPVSSGSSVCENSRKGKNQHKSGTPGIFVGETETTDPKREYPVLQPSDLRPLKRRNIPGNQQQPVDAEGKSTTQRNLTFDQLKVIARNQQKTAWDNKKLTEEEKSMDLGELAAKWRWEARARRNQDLNPTAVDYAKLGKLEPHQWDLGRKEIYRIIRERKQKWFVDRMEAKGEKLFVCAQCGEITTKNHRCLKTNLTVQGKSGAKKTLFATSSGGGVTLKAKEVPDVENLDNEIKKLQEKRQTFLDEQERKEKLVLGAEGVGKKPKEVTGTAPLTMWIWLWWQSKSLRRECDRSRKID